ncbi:nucleoside 2-deoxyribosyltransferase [uncultured Pseudacidovorax sp.]|uniref:nucleoside 2-deoxyribosyltransferase n=1 Tax=uncultured Pseudacidovorax sp. TaxID=679313 RepID=UPI0025F8E151|nr:nucleoside 2-deoxyribosyltransferase [uncultured Pseudacidovorax sp.]
MNADSPRPRVYLAGPDIFRADHAAVFQELKRLCSTCGLEGVAPSDAQVDLADTQDSDEEARRIYQGNIDLIRSSAGVIANLQCFRGLEPDSGTVFEVGFAIALGKPVVAYGVPSGSYAERVQAVRPCGLDARGVLREQADGTEVEGRGQRLNLMLTGAARLAEDAADAIRMLAGLLEAGAR